MSMLSRRDALGLMTAAGGMTALPGLGSAQSADPVYQAFEAAREGQDWTLGWVDAPAEGLDGVARRLHGAMPAGLQGVLHRNGPGRFSRDNYRYRHWFDGDGFVHAWQLSEDGVSHRARFVETPKWQMEEEAGRFLMPALASVPPNHGGVRGPDDMNVANTSVMMSGGELLALWEGVLPGVSIPTRWKAMGPGSGATDWPACPSRRTRRVMSMARSGISARMPEANASSCGRSDRTAS